MAIHQNLMDFSMVRSILHPPACSEQLNQSGPVTVHQAKGKPSPEVYPTTCPDAAALIANNARLHARQLL